MVVLNRIYTRTGDDGTSALATGERRPKSDLRFEAIGTIDETNAHVGLARLEEAALGPDVAAMLARIQNDLFDLGADLATPEKARGERLRISHAQVERLEREIDTLNDGAGAADLVRAARRFARRRRAPPLPHGRATRRAADGRACRGRGGQPGGAPLHQPAVGLLLRRRAPRQRQRRAATCSGNRARTAREPERSAWLSFRSTTPTRSATSRGRGWRGGFSPPTCSSSSLVEGGQFVGEPRRASVGAFGLIPAVINGYAHKPIELAGLPDWVTFITYAFIHADFWHLAGNMIFLWVFADNVEDALGHVPLLHLLLAVRGRSPATPSSFPTRCRSAPVIGASGAIAGNIGAYLLLHPRAKIWVLIMLRIPLRLPRHLDHRLLDRGSDPVGVQQPTAPTRSPGGPTSAAWLPGMVLIVFMRQPGVPLFAPAPNETPPRLSSLPPRNRLAGTGRRGAPPADPPMSSGPWG